MITATILTLAIGVALVSFLELGQTTLKISNRAFHANAAMNLAESGLEQAMWSISKAVDGDAFAWAGWTTSGANAQRKFTGFNYDANTTGFARVYVRNYALASAPTIIVRGTITPVSGPIIVKWVVVSLFQRSLFANGLVAKDTLTFSGGNAVVADSITVTGGSEFHYDEALASMTSGNLFGVSQWAELTSATQRSVYTGIMSW